MGTLGDRLIGIRVAVAPDLMRSILEAFSTYPWCTDVWRYSLAMGPSAAEYCSRYIPGPEHETGRVPLVGLKFRAWLKDRWTGK